MSKITKEQVDLCQGLDREDRKFGYVHGEDGGFFFTWHPTLHDTLESIEADEQDGDGGLTLREVRSFLAEYLPETGMGRHIWPNEEQTRYA